MKIKRKNFVLDRLHSFKYAAYGLFYLIKNENAFKTHIFIAILLTITGFYFDLTPTLWIHQNLILALMMSIEAINTGIEKIADFVEPNLHPKIKIIKDISAAAVLVSAIFGIIIISLIYIPKIMHYYSL